MSNNLSKLKFYTRYYWNVVVNYFTDILNAIIGQTRKQANFLEALLDRSVESIARLTAENRKLRQRVAELEVKECCKKIGTVKAVAKARPKKTK